MKKVYMSIDIGTDSIKYIVSEYLNKKVYLLASNVIKTKGIRKGLVVDPNLVINALKDGLKELDERLSIPIRKALVNIPSYNAKFLYVESDISITSEDKLITTEDVTSILKKIVKGKLDIDHELVTVVPLDFIIDNKKGIKYPVGKSGKKLELKGIMISVPKKNIYSVLGAMDGAGIEVVDITFGGLADYYEIRNNELDKLVGAVINIGHDTTTVSIINKSRFMNAEILQIGGRNIERDISRVFGINLIDARILKEKFTSAHKRFSNITEIFEVRDNNNKLIKLNQVEVSEVVMERVKEILEYAEKQILLLTKQDINYIILTGGVTELKNFKHLAYEVLGKDVIIYSSNTLGARSNKYTTALGMVKYIIDKMEVRGKEYTMIDNAMEIELITPRSKRGKKDIINNIKKIGSFLNIKEEKVDE